MKKVIVILGIISLIISIIPFCGVIAIVPAVIGIILGIWYSTKENNKKGMVILGTILSVLALMIICFWIIVFGVTSMNSLYKINTKVEEINNKIETLNITNNNQ